MIEWKDETDFILNSSCLFCTWSFKILYAPPIQLRFVCCQLHPPQLPSVLRDRLRATAICLSIEPCESHGPGVPLETLIDDTCHRGPVTGKPQIQRLGWSGRRISFDSSKGSKRHLWLSDDDSGVAVAEVGGTCITGGVKEEEL